MNPEDNKLCIAYIDAVKNTNTEPDIGPLILKYRKFDQYFKELVALYEQIHKTYTYMLTFTIDPRKCAVDDHDEHFIIEAYIIDWAEKRHPLKSDLVCEGTDQDHKHVHWHLGLELKKYIDFSNFLKHYRKKYGNVDISKSWSNDYTNIIKYINKSVPSQKIV